jgi:predicted ribosomally synthesized peptide with SipW-like signal peptide
MTTRKKLLITVAVLGAAVAVIGGGTYATFSAQVRNPSNTFATGTLVLSNKVGSGTTCLSTGGGTTDSNVNNACDTAFNLTVKKPGDSGSANLTLKNEGSLDATTFEIFSAACASANAAGENYHGTGNACNAVDVTVQQYSDSGFTTSSSCVYGGGTATTCAFDDTKTLGTFQTAYSSSSTALSLGSLTAGSSNYYTISVKLPLSANNTYQGRSATIDFTWYAAQ